MLLSKYESILLSLDYSKCDPTNDKYSGVFLPVAFDEYHHASKKIMVIGRETAGWNTNNNKNTLKRILDQGAKPTVEEATNRYRTHLLDSNGKNTTKSRSRFKQYYFKIAKELQLDPSALIYGNFFAWDYNKKTPLTRPETELREIKRISIELLAAQIEEFKPDVIIFSTGARKEIDEGITELFDTHFDGCVTNKETFVSKKFWEFKAGGATCFRIAHPRATHGHQTYRKLLIERLKGIK